MELILFTPSNVSQKAMNLTKIIRQTVQDCDIQTISGFNALKARLKKVSMYEKEIFILLADSRDCLTRLTSLMDLMENKRIVLILPDDEKTTVTLGLQFCPRFFTDINDLPENLCAVLTKMTQPNKK